MRVSYCCHHPFHTSERCGMGDRGREGAAVCCKTWGGTGWRCGWEGGDQRRQMTEPEPRAEKGGVGALQGAREAILGQVPVPLRVAWECRARQPWVVGWPEAGILGSFSHLTPLLSCLIWLNLWEILPPPPPCQTCNFLPSAAGLGDPVAVCLSHVCVVRSG